MRKPVKSVNAQRADDLHEHARRCKSDPTECRACVKNIQFFRSQSLPILDEMLSDTPAVQLRTSFAAVAIDNYIDRTNHSQTDRVRRDVAASFALFSGYKNMGGRL